MHLYFISLSVSCALPCFYIRVFIFVFSKLFFLYILSSGSTGLTSSISSCAYTTIILKFFILPSFSLYKFFITIIFLQLLMATHRVIKIKSHSTGNKTAFRKCFFHLITKWMGMFVLNAIMLFSVKMKMVAISKGNVAIQDLGLAWELIL